MYCNTAERHSGHCERRCRSFHTTLHSPEADIRRPRPLRDLEFSMPKPDIAGLGAVSGGGYPASGECKVVRNERQRRSQCPECLSAVLQYAHMPHTSCSGVDIPFACRYMEYIGIYGLGPHKCRSYNNRLHMCNIYEHSYFKVLSSC